MLDKRLTLGTGCLTLTYMNMTNQREDEMSEQVTFEPGQRVSVAANNTAAYEGEIVRYWRNGAWIVREPVHGTECAHFAKDLTLA